MKKKYAHIELLSAEIIELRKQGYSRSEIGKKLNLSKIQIKNWINRQNRKNKTNQIPKSKGRPRKSPLSKERELELQISKLMRENDLLRSFLHAAGRM